MPLMRLQKFLSEAGACSRRRGEKHILAGEVAVNGEVVTALGTKVDPHTDTVHLKGIRVASSGTLFYVMLNKPAGVVTSCEHRGEPVVTDLVDLPQRLFPVGRLDKDSTGLLLLTNDGRIHHRLSHPSFDHEKEYDVSVRQPIDDASLDAMRKGMRLDGAMTRRARVKRISANRFRIVLKEGKNRQIRRMVGKVGNRVTRLHRIRMADLRLGRLANRVRERRHNRTAVRTVCEGLDEPVFGHGISHFVGSADVVENQQTVVRANVKTTAACYLVRLPLNRTCHGAAGNNSAVSHDGVIESMTLSRRGKKLLAQACVDGPLGP